MWLAADNVVSLVSVDVASDVDANAFVLSVRRRLSSGPAVHSALLLVCACFGGSKVATGGTNEVVRGSCFVMEMAAAA